MVDIPVVTRNGCPSYLELQKSAKIHSHFQYIDSLVDLPVSVQHRGPTVQRLGGFSQWQYLDQEIACTEGWQCVGVPSSFCEPLTLVLQLYRQCQLKG